MIKESKHGGKGDLNKYALTTYLPEEYRKKILLLKSINPKFANEVRKLNMTFIDKMMREHIDDIDVFLSSCGVR